MVTLDEIKDWLKIDGEDEDNTLSSLILTSQSMIKSSTGITKDDVENNKDALELYKTLQKIYVSILYEGNIRDLKNPGVISLSVNLENMVQKNE